MCNNVPEPDTRFHVSRPLRRAVAALCLILLASVAHAEEATLWGTFANPAQSDAAIDAAIESVIAKMSPVTRPFARAEVKAASPTFRRVALQATTDAIIVRFDIGPPVRTPSDGASARWTRADGQVYDVQAQISDGHLRQSFTNKGGSRINTFALSRDGRTLTIDVLLESTRLPEPVQYQLVFYRLPAVL